MERFNIAMPNICDFQFSELRKNIQANEGLIASAARWSFLDQVLFIVSLNKFGDRWCCATVMADAHWIAAEINLPYQAFGFFPCCLH
jgi:hypothetical protein